MSSSNTFAGIPQMNAGIETAKTVLIPVPFSANGKKHKGPDAFLAAAEKLEHYDIETDSEPYLQGIAIADEIAATSEEDVVSQVYAEVKDLIKRSKFVTLFGGNHTISIGAIRAANELFEDLTILQLDAHANVRRKHNGSKLNNCCALSEANQEMNLIQVGIRSMNATEKTLINEDNVFFASEMLLDEYWMDTAVDALKDDVYITLDLDVFDPSIFPSTENPEPGGMGWFETLELIKRVFDERNVVGFDIVGLDADLATGNSEYLAAKLYYKMIAYKFNDVDPAKFD
ncbi:MAG: arginase family protein [Leeuwenhoekiella sp.]